MKTKALLSPVITGVVMLAAAALVSNGGHATSLPSRHLGHQPAAVIVVPRAAPSTQAHLLTLAEDGGQIGLRQPDDAFSA